MPPATYSIVACDLERREWGVGVASKFLAIGALSAWAEPEVGAVATQAWIRASHGEDGLGLLRQGLSAEETVERLVTGDDGRDRRQLGVVDRDGNAASYTGSGCLEWAGERLGRAYAVQGNLLVSSATLDALAEAFERTQGAQLAERLLAGLVAAQTAGGDRRGQQSAALRVGKADGGYGGWKLAVDLRVDDSPDSITELERLYDLHQLYFGSTPESKWIDVTPALRAEIRERLDRLGYRTGDLSVDLDAWAGTENLEERVHGSERLDPVLLAELRRK